MKVRDSICTGDFSHWCSCTDANPGTDKQSCRVPLCCSPLFETRVSCTGANQDSVCPSWGSHQDSITGGYPKMAVTRANPSVHKTTEHPALQCLSDGAESSCRDQRGLVGVSAHNEQIPFKPDGHH